METMKKSTCNAASACVCGGVLVPRGFLAAVVVVVRVDVVVRAAAAADAVVLLAPAVPFLVVAALDAV